MTVNFGTLSDASPVQSYCLVICRRSAVALGKTVSPTKEEVCVHPSCVLAKSHVCLILNFLTDFVCFRSGKISI